MIGSNGGGKSTLLSLIGRLMPLQSGRSLVNSTDIATTPTLDLARSLRVRQLVGFGRWPHHQGRPTAIWSRRR